MAKATTFKTVNVPSDPVAFERMWQEMLKGPESFDKLREEFGGGEISIEEDEEATENAIAEDMKEDD